ncbi:MAG: outer membrane beta-barrel protein [Defluviicoccus sp.]|nr:outer membrane beta-barrel protein [Defluviicoccus sp.]MDE0384187.1 outer membrane beta-barrel protein [Defluviicoccus sp.]
MARIGLRVGAGALAAALALAAAEAGAADGRMYAGLNVPVMFVDDTDSTTAGMQAGDPRAPAMRSPYRASSTAEHRTGFKVAGVVGWEFGGGLRVEGELFFARSEVERLTYEGVNASGLPLTGGVDVPIDGTADQLGGFANLWYDIELGGDWLPFAGGGLGFIRIDQSGLDYDANRLVQEIANRLTQGQGPQYPPGFVPEISTVDNVLAWHLGAGLGYRLNDNVILQAGYRFQAASDLGFDGRNEFGTVDVETAMRVHFLEIGVRYRF